ncbi:MAG: serine/threonine-protein kinase [Candidatus Uhrbacteria bacterium]
MGQGPEIILPPHSTTRLAPTPHVDGVAPGVIFATETEAYLILEKIGEGGICRAFLATPMHTARFTETAFAECLPPYEPRRITRLFVPESPLLSVLSMTAPTCVLKILAVERDDPLYAMHVARLRQEAACYGTISDHRLPKLHAAGEAPIPHLAIQHFRGETLRDIIEEYHGQSPPQRMPLPRAIAILRKVAAAVESLHRAGIVHRDVKPENTIMVTPEGEEESPRIIDLGLARWIPQPGLETALGDVRPRDRGITQFYGGIGGTPEYAAPEQFDPSVPVTSAVDTFAVATMAYELLAGQLPYQSTNPIEIPTLRRSRLPPPFDRPELPRETCTALYRIILRGMSVDLSQRSTSPTVCIDALREVLENERRMRLRNERAAAVGRPAIATPRRSTPRVNTPTPRGRYGARLTPPPVEWHRQAWFGLPALFRRLTRQQ